MFQEVEKLREYKNILITGGLGFIGSHFTFLAKSLNQFRQIVIVDSGTYACNGDLVSHFVNDGIIIYKMDINDKTIENVMVHHEIDLIVHFAAESHVSNSHEAPDLFITTNVNGTFNLINIAKKVWGERKDVLFHHVSTDEVFGSVSAPIDETERYNPGNPYSASKASSDHIVEAYGNSYGIQYTISHGCNTFGIFQNEEKFIPLIIKRLVEGKTLTLHKGDHFRQWIPVEFHALAIWRIICDGVIGSHYMINLGEELVLSNRNVIESILVSSQNVIKPYDSIDPTMAVIEEIEDRPGNDHKYCSKSDGIKSLFDEDEFSTFQLSVSSYFENTIKFYIEKYSKESE